MRSSDALSERASCHRLALDAGMSVRGPRSGQKSDLVLVCLPDMAAYRKNQYRHRNSVTEVQHEVSLLEEIASRVRLFPNSAILPFVIHMFLPA